MGVNGAVQVACKEAAVRRENRAREREREATARIAGRLGWIAFVSSVLFGLLRHIPSRSSES